MRDELLREFIIDVSCLDSTYSRIFTRNNEILDEIFGKKFVIVFFKIKKNLLFSHVIHIINETVRLFSLGSILPDSNIGRILPLHFVALLDTDANWFRTWMVSSQNNKAFVYLLLFFLQHATYSRVYVLHSLETTKNLVRHFCFSKSKLKL